MADNFLTLPALAKTRLEEIANRVVGVHPVNTKVFHIETNSLDPVRRPRELLRQVEDWSKDNSGYIYYIRASSETDLGLVEKAFSEAKKREKNERAYSRYTNPSYCFYVGSSSDIAQRFREHLGYGSRKTYALQFAHWSQGLQLSLEFVVGEYQPAPDQEILQALEDAFWDKMHPMFGRRGGR